MYLTKAKQLVTELDFIRPEKIYACTEAEVKALAAKLSVVIPAVFREFLLWCGKGLGDVMCGSDFYYPCLWNCNLQQEAITLLEADGKDATLAQDAIVFFMHQGYQFAYIRTNEGEDPPVYYYLEGKEIEKISDCFSDYVCNIILDYQQNAGSILIYKFEDINNLSVPDYRVTSLSFNSTIKFNFIPEEVFRFKNLVELDLRYFDLKAVSPRIQELQNLTQLNLNSNQLTKLPKELTSLSKLEILYLSNNKLKTVIETLRKIPIKYGSINGNLIPSAELQQIKNEFPNIYLG